MGNYNMKEKVNIKKNINNSSFWNDFKKYQNIFSIFFVLYFKKNFKFNFEGFVNNSRMFYLKMEILDN